MPFKYQSGEEIRKGDRVLFHGESGQIELVADSSNRTAETEWYIQEYGGGVMAVEPRSFVRAFISDTEDTEDLILVSRSEDSNAIAKS